MTRISNQNQYNIVVVNGALWLRDKIRNEIRYLYVLTPEEVARFTVNPPRVVIDETLIGQELQTRRLSFTWRSRPCQTLPPVYDRNYDAPASKSLMACEQDYGTDVVHNSEARALRQTIYDLLRSQNDREFGTMPDEKRWLLAYDLMHACLRALEGVWGLQGSRAKPAATVLDILVYDVCWALWWAGVPVIADPDPTISLAQGMALKMTRLVGLAGHGGKVGTLYDQMRRSRRFLGAHDWDERTAQAWLDGRLVADLSERA
jgi:hypothetical protein